MPSMPPRLYSSTSNLPRAGPTEFVAVLIVGFGEELRPLTSDRKEETSPKALLPIANKPLISYPLAWIEESSISDVIVLCPESHANAISNHLASDVSSISFPKLSITLHVFPDEYRGDPSVGTATILKQFKEHVSADFVILPCDFIPPPTLQLSTLLDKFRMDPDGLILAGLFYEGAPPTVPVAGQETMPAAPTVVYDPDHSLLLKLAPATEDQDEDSKFDIRMEMLHQHPRARLSTNLHDAHVYLCKQEVLNLLEDDVHRFQSLREDFVPWLVEIQHRARRRTKWGGRFVDGVDGEGWTVLAHSTNHPLAARNPTSVALGKAKRGPTLSRTISQFGDDNAAESDVDLASTRCAILVHRHTAKDEPALRINNLAAYYTANRTAWSKATFAPSDSHVIEPQAQVTTNVILGHSTRVGERSNIKQSVVGPHCNIGKGVRIVGCVIMDHCVISDGAKLDGCVLATRTTVGAKATLTHCFTQPGYEVDAGATVKGEKLDHSEDAWDEEEEDEDDATGAAS